VCWPYRFFWRQGNCYLIFQSGTKRTDITGTKRTETDCVPNQKWHRSNRNAWHYNTEMGGTKRTEVSTLHCNHSDNPKARGIEVYVGKNESRNSKESVWFAYQLQNQIKKQLGLDSRGVKFADFQVFRETVGYCTSVLLELGFLSNKEDYKSIFTKLILLAISIMKIITQIL